MIAFAIMMFFVSFNLLCISIVLFKGNTSVIHGKVYENTSDKVGYAKSLSKPVLLICIGVLISGAISLVLDDDIAIIYAFIVFILPILISDVWFLKIQKKYRNR